MGGSVVGGSLFEGQFLNHNSIFIGVRRIYGYKKLI